MKDYIIGLLLGTIATGLFFLTGDDEGDDEDDTY